MFSPVGPYAGLGRFAGYSATGQNLGPSTGTLVPGTSPYYPRVQVGTGLIHPSLYNPANIHMHNFCRQLTAASVKDLQEKEFKTGAAAPMAHYMLPLPPLHVATPRRDAVGDCGLDLSHRDGARSPGPASDHSATESPTSSPLSFSIDSILGRDRVMKKVAMEAAPAVAGGPGPSDGGDDMEWMRQEEDDGDREQESTEQKYSWLQCTRYKPPKLPRSKKKEGGKKRKLGRNPRVPFTQHQVVMLEQKFRHTHYLSSVDVAELSAKLNLTETRVKIWFQNRRARERRDRDGCLPPSAPPNVLRHENGVSGPQAQDSSALSPTLSPRDTDDPTKGLQSTPSPTSSLQLPPFTDINRLPLAFGGSRVPGKGLGIRDLENLSWHAKNSAFTPVVR